MDLEKIIEIAHQIADPYIKSAEAWKFCCYVLSALFILSVGANIYLATKDVDIVIENDSSFIESDNNINEVSGR